ncbi:MAG: sorbosone dehydrogenase family protein, partial [Usitatibacter sp.]
MKTASLTTAALCGALLAACADSAKLPPNADVGPNPTLVAPHRSLIPTVNVATAKPFAAGEMPIAAQGLRVNVFASGLDHPRWLHVLPNGDVLVAESNAPPRPEEGKGIKAKFMQYFMKKAGAGVPSANRITLLRDVDGDGVAEVKSAFLENLHSPFGMALVGETLYVANADAIVKFPYREGDTRITAAPVKVADLPGGPRNHHWTKSLVA